ncbi:EamA/RhaT family transporter [Paucihalobacter ruber]|uniref:EamA/RhaT family transporter n=1 Tax=Paucihalobacter ruber TaxID=2567861 RepID=A0A506PFV3_9FLAO|nr:EamA family transporter [Paucihalobacter ruber]TPV32275.1 EamA/RhaT family transporter [Paucihalobacter ruber]
MIYLIFSILSSTAIFILFKLLNIYKINTLQAIVVNYFVAATVGFLSYDNIINFEVIYNSKWFVGAVILGCLFIAIFNVMAITAQKNGISIASVASKMSVIIPIIFGIYIYNEKAGFLKIAGILVALIAVYLASIKTKENQPLTKSILLPTILFFGSGIIETSLKFIESNYVESNGIPIFSATIFACAAAVGFAILILKFSTKAIMPDFKSIPAGIVLGIVNYYSIYFLLKALQYNGSESSTIFTLNNVSIVMLSSVLGFVIFKERLSLKNITGIILAVLSIILVTSA